MARIAHVTLVDDIDGSPASETVFFALGGRHYDIDLSAENAAKLRAGLGPFVAAVRGSYRSSYHSKSIDRSSCTIPFPAAWIRLSQT